MMTGREWWKSVTNDKGKYGKEKKSLCQTSRQPAVGEGRIGALMSGQVHR